MEEYIVTLYYPKDKYPTFDDVLNNITNNDIYYKVQVKGSKQLLCYSDKKVEFAIIGIDRFILEPQDFFVPYNIKKYIADQRSAYSIYAMNGKLLFRSKTHHFIDNRANGNFNLYKFDKFDVYHDFLEDVLLIVSYDDVYHTDKQKFMNVYNEFNASHDFGYQLVGSDYSLDHHVVKLILKEKRLHKLLKKCHLIQ